jgi:BMFP domain-containing protein YqiC
MARLSREENEALKTRVAALEAKLGSAGPAASGDQPDISDMRLDG